jgi:hypothetical protein
MDADIDALVERLRVAAHIIARLLSDLEAANKRAEAATIWAEAAEIDSERLQWLIDNCPYLPMRNGKPLPVNSRDAIDAARQDSP